MAASGLRLNEYRNSQLGFALAFPFSSTSQTISGFETFGDNQFVTPITAFPIARDQEKYQVRYAVSHSQRPALARFGVDFIHEPVMSGALPGNAENLTVFAQNPADYLGNPQQFAVDLNCTPTETLAVTPGTTCTSTPAGNGSFSQNVQRLGIYAEDSWRASSNLTVNYRPAIRHDVRTVQRVGPVAVGKSGAADGGSAADSACFQHPAAPHDYRRQFGPRLGIAYAPGRSRNTVFRAGFGLFYNDLAQNGWVTALQAVNEPPALAEARRCGLYSGCGLRRRRLDDRSGLQDALCHCTPARACNMRSTRTGRWARTGLTKKAYTPFAATVPAGYTLFSPLFASDMATSNSTSPT